METNNHHKMTLIEKILANKSGKKFVKPGGSALNPELEQHPPLARTSPSCKMCDNYFAFT